MKSYLPGAIGGIGIVMAVALIPSFEWALAFVALLAGGTGALTFFGMEKPKPVPIVDPASMGGNKQESGPIIDEEQDFPDVEFDKTKAQDGVELVERLHKTIPIGPEDHAEMTYSYPGVKGRIVKGKAPQKEEQKAEADQSDGTVIAA